MLRLGIGQRFFTTPYGFEEGIVRMKKQGYSSMDYPEFGNTETELYQKNAEQFKEYLLYQKAVCEREGIEIYQTHGPWRYPPQDFTEEDREERFEKMSRAIEGTEILGCKNIVIHPLMPFTINDEGHEKETYDINLEFFGKLCKVAESYDVVINFENMPMRHFSLASISAMMKLVKEINSDYFKVCLDTGHSSAIGNSPADDVRLLGKEYLYSLHMHDNNGRSDYHWHPFAGVVDWKDFCLALREIEYDGVLNLEVGRQKNLPEELREMEEVFLHRKLQCLAKMVAGQNI